MSYKVFSNGSVLNASELNEFLMNQSVIAFSNATARSSAITSPIEGMVTWLEDVNRYDSYNGTAWVPLIPESQGNAIINGAFDIWQRGSSLTTSAGSYLADRWVFNAGGAGSVTLSRQTFTPGEAPFAPEESAFFSRINITSAFTASNYDQRIEDVRTFAGKTVTLSFYAKADSPKTVTPRIQQNFGSGGSASVSTDFSPVELTTSWQRFSRTLLVPSVAGKTIGSGSFISAIPFLTGTQTGTFDIWGVQLEAGPVATPFRRNANSIQGELAACQRYYVRFDNSNGGSNFSIFSPSGVAETTTIAIGYTPLPVEMRVVPTSIEWGGTIGVTASSGALINTTAVALSDRRTNKMAAISYTVASGLTANSFASARASSSATAFIAFSAEL